MQNLILLSVNNSWNILNFRMGLVSRLQRSGFTIGVISPCDAHSAALAAHNIRHIPAAIDSKGLKPTADLRLWIRYLIILRANRPAGLMTWTVKPNIYGSLAARLVGIPVINNVSGLGTAFIRLGPLTTLVSFLYRLAFSRSATIFFQNPDDRQLFVGKRLVPIARTALLPGSGIDTEHFKPNEQAGAAAVSAQPFTFLMVARLLRDKGIIEYVQAARIARAHGIDARFAVLGSLDAANRTAISRDELTSWIDEGLITYLGSADDVRPYIAAADCVVLPSYREGLPRALLEGASMAKPLIATRVPGCVEIARESENALLCTARDAASLADAMLLMARMPEDQRLAMGAAGRRIAVHEFDENIVLDRYMNALTAALSPSENVKS